MKRLVVLLGFVVGLFSVNGQTISIEGYVFESNNSGYVNQAKIMVLDSESKAVKGEVETNLEGFFSVDVPAGREYIVRATKKIFETNEQIVSTVGKTAGEKAYVKMSMDRKPGYIFEVTMAESRVNDEIPVDAIEGARIEIYNNTAQKEELVIESHPSPAFSFTFEQGNHYTILIRKDNYFNKRMEAYVNVKGCILCFDGIGDVQPGVSDNLTAGHQMGTLLANVELQPIELNKTIKVDNIYYDYNKATLRPEAKKELDILVTVLKNNPAIVVELGSHTDSRGKDDYNMVLSQDRAQAAVDYIIENGVDASRIVATGYGEDILVNKCSNGVECSEDEHQLNRRTELKILGIMDYDPYKEMSLAQIIKEEQFGQMLEEVQNQEVVKVEAGQELPPEIQAQNETVTTTTETIVEEVIEPVMEVETVVTETRPTYQQEPTQMEGTIIETTTVPSTTYETPTTTNQTSTTIQDPAATNRSKMESLEGRQEVIEEVVETTYTEPAASSVQSSGGSIFEPVGTAGTNVTSTTLESEPELIREPTVKPKPKQPKKETKSLFDKTRSDSYFVAEQEVLNDRIIPKPKSLPKDYSGYRIEIYASKHELPMSHEIFSNHGNITLEQKRDGSFAYLLGEFRDYDDAKHFLQNIIIKRYPGAELVRYRFGKRTD